MIIVLIYSSVFRRLSKKHIAAVCSVGNSGQLIYKSKNYSSIKVYLRWKLLIFQLLIIICLPHLWQQMSQFCELFFFILTLVVNTCRDFFYKNLNIINLHFDDWIWIKNNSHISHILRSGYLPNFNIQPTNKYYLLPRCRVEKFHSYVKQLFTNLISQITILNKITEFRRFSRLYYLWCIIWKKKWNEYERITT